MTVLNIPMRLRSIAGRRGRHTALIDAAGSSTYAELVEAMDSVAAALSGMGIAPGERLGIAMQPSSTYAALLCGCYAAGVVPAPINTRLTPAEARAFLQTLEPQCVLADAAFADLARATGYPSVLLEAAYERTPLRARLAPVVDGPIVMPPAPEDAPAMIVATGGTTGTPKGVYYDHRGWWLFMASAAAYDHGNRFDVQLSMSPFFHVAVGTGVIARLFAGGAVRVLPKFDAGEALAAIEQGCTRMAAATTLLQMIKAHPRFEETRRAGVLGLRIGGMAASLDFLAEVMRDYPNAAVRHSYAATEFGSITAIEHADFVAGRIAGVGRPHPGAEVTVMRPDRNEASVGEIGELVVRAPWRSCGYWGRPDETAETYRPEGIYSGDLGFVDEDGWFTISGRRKEMIITGGENVFPAEVEEALRRHPAVADIIVYGVPDHRWGERIEAAVVIRPGGALTLDELRAHGRVHLAGYKLPKTMCLIDEVPLTTVRKPDRRAARGSALLNARTGRRAAQEPE